MTEDKSSTKQLQAINDLKVAIHDLKMIYENLSKIYWLEIVNRDSMGEFTVSFAESNLKRVIEALEEIETMTLIKLKDNEND